MLKSNKDKINKCVSLPNLFLALSPLGPNNVGKRFDTEFAIDVPGTAITQHGVRDER